MTNWVDAATSKKIERQWQAGILQAIIYEKDKQLKALLVKLDTLLFRINTLYNTDQVTTEQYCDAIAEWLDLLEDGMNAV